MSLISKIRTVLTLGQGVVRGLPDLAAGAGGGGGGGADPLALFGQWFDAARRSGMLLPEAMTVATSTPGGAPSARMMLLKGFDERGFAFYTNYQSRKGAELTDNPRAALVFHWPILERQVRVEGSVARMSEQESQAYFHARPRGSRIGAWASKQSAPLRDRRELERRVEEFHARFSGDDVPLPPYWGGFRLSPVSIEFWQGRLDRLHDRLRFTREGGSWTVRRLYP